MARGRPPTGGTPELRQNSKRQKKKRYRSGFRILCYPNCLDYDECFFKRAIRWHDSSLLEERPHELRIYIRIEEPRSLDDATLVRIKQLEGNDDAAPQVAHEKQQGLLAKLKLVRMLSLAKEVRI